MSERQGGGHLSENVGEKVFFTREVNYKNNKCPQKCGREERPNLPDIHSKSVCFYASPKLLFIFYFQLPVLDHTQDCVCKDCKVRSSL